MKIDALYQAVEDSSHLSHLSLDDLRQIVRQFPYFQTARKLLLRKLKEDENLSFDRELKQSAFCIGDRAKLYFYLNSDSDTSELVDTALPELSLIRTAAQKEDNVSASYGSREETNFNYLFLSEDEARAINEQEVSSGMMDVSAECVEGGDEESLIDRFMNSGAKKIKPPQEPTSEMVDLAQDSAKENPAVLTETLAKIYIKQKKYDKAIGIFKSLSLKNPEKNAYFAARINEIELLIKSS